MLRKLKVLIVILLVILLTVVAFVGVYKKENGVWKNVLPDYQYGMDAKGSRQLRYTLDTSEEEKYVYVDEEGKVVGEVLKDGSATTEDAEKEETSSDTDEVAETSEENLAEEKNDSEEEIPYAKETRTIKKNDDEKLTKENFEKSKKIIQERLEKQGISEYNIRIDDVTGKLVVETGNDNDNVDLVKSIIGQAGKFKIIDYQNGLPLMDNSDIKNVTVVTSNQDTYKTYLQIEFNKAGAKKLKEISNKYVKEESTAIENEDQTEENTEEENDTESSDNNEEEEKIKYVSIVLDDTTMMTTYFGEEMGNGKIQVSVGKERTDYDEFLEDYESAQTIANILNAGAMPVEYELENDNFVKSELKMVYFDTVLIIAVLLFAIYFIVKYRLDGVFAAILSIGYMSLMSLVVKYTNVTLTANSEITIILMVLANDILLNMILQNIKQKGNANDLSEPVKAFSVRAIPAVIMAIVFTLTTSLTVSSIGMILFWGFVLMAIYNFAFTRTLLKR